MSHRMRGGGLNGLATCTSRVAPRKVANLVGCVLAKGGVDDPSSGGIGRVSEGIACHEHRGRRTR